jgi:hypothetical protein
MLQAPPETRVDKDILHLFHGRLKLGTYWACIYFNSCNIYIFLQGGSLGGMGEV